MNKYNKFHLIEVVVVFAITCLNCSKGFSMADDQLLEKRIVELRSLNKGEKTDWGKLETECNNLIEDYNSPPEKGKIYATIALICAKSGYSSLNDMRIPQAIKYCKKALEYPLEVTTACEMYGRLTGALMVSYWSYPEEEFIKRRREAIVPCLTGLKLALDNKAPKQLEPPPGVMRIGGVSPDSQQYKKLKEKYEQQLATRKKWEFENKLYFQRKSLTQMCVSLYSHKPYNPDELKNIAEKILKGHEDSSKELISEVEAVIAKKEKNIVPNQDAK